MSVLQASKRWRRYDSLCWRISTWNVKLWFALVLAVVSHSYFPCNFTACLHGGGGPHVGGVTRLSIKSLILIWSCLHDRWVDQMRDCMDRRVTPPKRVTSPTWGPPPPCKQTLTRSTQHLIRYSSPTTKLCFVFIAALSSLRDLSKATSILSDPSKVPEQALRASVTRDPTDLAALMAPPEAQNAGGSGDFSWECPLITPSLQKDLCCSLQALLLRFKIKGFFLVWYRCKLQHWFWCLRSTWFG